MAAKKGKAQQGPGRPSKLSTTRKKKLLRALRQGNFIEVACTYAGIGNSTFYRWLEKGKKSQTGEYREFWEEVQGALAEAEYRVVRTLNTHFKESPQACINFLKARWRNRWGDQIDIGESDGDVKIILTTRRKNDKGETEERPVEIPITEI